MCFPPESRAVHKAECSYALVTGERHAQRYESAVGVSGHSDAGKIKLIKETGSSSAYTRRGRAGSVSTRCR